MALLNLDVAIRARCAILEVKVGMQYWAAAPAITSESQNAAPIYEKVFGVIPENSAANIYNPPFGGKEIFDPSDPATVSFLTKYATEIALLRHAASLPACRFDGDLEDPILAQSLPDLNQVRYASMALDLDAREQITHGHVAPAIDDIAAVFGMSRQFGQRPTELLALIGMGIDDQGIGMLERVLPVVRTRDELAGLHLDNLMPIGRMLRQALRGEEQFGLIQYNNMPFGQVNSTVEVGAPAMPIMPLTDTESIFFRVFILDQNDYIQFMQECQADAIQPYYKIRNQLPDAQKARWGMLTSILATPFSHVLRSCGRQEAKDACAQAAVAMTRYRLDNGALPFKLADLVPKYLDAIPTDPFDGQPLRQVIRDNSWIIYSVGPNAIDDGGVGYDKKHKTKDDVTFTLNAAPAPATTKQ
jgi:hypothetical protein